MVATPPEDVLWCQMKMKTRPALWSEWWHEERVINRTQRSVYLEDWGLIRLARRQLETTGQAIVRRWGRLHRVCTRAEMERLKPQQRKDWADASIRYTT
jgi:hypothetical protein